MVAGIRVRGIRLDEFDEVSALVRAAYADDYALSADYLAEIADVRGRAEISEVLVAEDPASGAILGTVTVPRAGERLQDDTADGEMDLRLLGVSRAARGRGVGRLLMEHCIELARERGASRLVLHTASTMEPAWRLYERMGFARIPEREYDFEVFGETRRLMSYGIAVVPVAA